MSTPKAERLRFLDYWILFTVSLVLALVGWYLAANLNKQNATYDQVIHTALLHTARDTANFVDDNTAILAFSRAKDFAGAKATGIFLGFLLVFTGALYLLKVFSLHYKLQAENASIGTIKFESTSPGLVILTLGAVIVICVLLTKNQLDYEVETSGSKAALFRLDSLQRAYDAIVDQLNHPLPAARHERHRAADVTGAVVADHRFLKINSPEDLNSASVRAYIKALAKRLKDNPDQKVSLTGQSEGSVVSEQLRKARDLGNAIKSLLVEMGISSTRVKVISYGQSPDAITTGAWKNGVQIGIK